MTDSDLAARRAALLRKRLAQAGVSGGSQQKQITRRSDPTSAPLSPAQRRMWVLDRADPSGVAYNVCLDVTFTGRLDVPALREAFRDLVARQEVLRTRYPLGPDQLPLQRIDPAPDDYPIPLVERPAEEVDELLTELSGHRFDLARDWPMRLALYRTGENEHRLGLVVHHIAWDGGTWPVISKDLTDAYTHQQRTQERQAQQAQAQQQQTQQQQAQQAQTRQQQTQQGQPAVEPAPRVSEGVPAKAGAVNVRDQAPEPSGGSQGDDKRAPGDEGACFSGSTPASASEPGWSQKNSARNRPKNTEIQYADWASVQADARAQPADRDYWVERLAGLPGALPLPADSPGERGGGRVSMRFGRDETARFTALAAARSVTPFTALIAAFGALLHRYGAGTDLPIGSASMNRDNAQTQALIGNFGNTLLLRLDAAGDPSFAELVRRADEVCSGGFAHQDMPYDQVVAALRERGTDGDLFNVMLLFLTQGMVGPELPGVDTSWRTVHNGTTQFDLSLEAFLIDGDLEIEATYSAELFSASRVTELLTDLRGLLRQVAEDPLAPLSALTVHDWGVETPRALPSATPTQAGDQEIEHRLRALMAELLEYDEVPADEDFFTLGGNSLLATKLVAQVRSAFGADVSVRTIAENRTAARLASVISGFGRAADWREVTKSPDIGTRPLSVPQHALWFLHQMTGPSPDYNLAFARRLTGGVDQPALRAAIADLVDRHDVLRGVISSDGVDVLDVDTAAEKGARLRVVECGADELDAAIDRELRYEFRLDAEPAFRPTLLRTGAEEVLLILAHHTVSDEWSETVLCADLSTAYRARVGGAAPKYDELPVGYADYARWQRGALDGAELEQQRAFWRETLRDLPEQVTLPTDRPRPAEPSTGGDLVTVPLPRPVLTGLRALASATGSSPFIVWHALVGLLLARNGAGTDIPVGTPVAGRGSSSLHGLVGMFVNSVVLRTDLSGNPTFRELVARVSDADVSAFANQDLPFERVVDLVAPPRVLGRSPLFQTMVVYGDATPPTLGLPGIEDEPLPVRLEIAKFDLSFTLIDTDADEPSASIRYSTALFDRSTAARLAAELRQLAEQVAADPDLPLARIEHLPPAERDQMLHGWNDTRAATSDVTLPEMFDAQVRATPDAVAVVCGDRELTYRELDRWSGGLAAELRRRGVGPERTVGIHLERSLEMIVALLAVQRSGGVFVPLEPSWPARRIADTLATSRPVLVLSQDPLSWTDVPAIAVAESSEEAPPLPDLDPENLAYVMYTSGSTGVPKGAMIRHRAIANRLLWQIDMLGFGPGDAALFKAPLGFDISINEIFLPLVCGARLVVCEPGLEREVDELAALIGRQRVTFCYLTSSMLELLLGVGRQGELTCLRHVWCGGELLTPELFARFRSQVDATLYHGYGPAEATIGVSHEIYREGHERGAVTIGKPNPNTAIYLLDEQLRAVSVGVAGEIHLGGLPLARGYVGEPVRTAERFVADPFGSAGSRLYRTGDLARWRSDGVLEFLGRADNQIKIRGMRVELEEIEAALARHPDVRQCAVRTHEGPTTRLVGYQVPVEGTGLDSATLRDWLTGQLPSHMVPDTIVTLDALPMLPSGKIDRAALPAPVLTRGSSRAPSGERETQLAALFAEVLGLSDPGAEDDFFSLGGDSISSIALVSAARGLGLRFTVRDVFAAPTIAALAPLVTDVEPDTEIAEGPDDRTELPLSPLQRGLVFHSLADETVADAYLAQPVLTFTGGVDPERLRAALHAVVHRHDSLRAAFLHEGRRDPVAVIAETVEVPWDEVDLRDANASTTNLRGQRTTEDRWTELRRERSTRFRLDRAPLMRATLARVGEDEHRLLLTNHHLLLDGWSLPLLVTDLLAAYADGSLPPAPGQYPRYLDWLARRDHAAAEQAWRTALDGVTGPTLLAGVEEHPYQPSEQLRLQLGPDLTADLTTLARAHGVTLNSVLMAGWGTLLGVLTGEPDVLFGMTVSGRPTELPEAARTVGLFINTIPARVTAAPDDTVGALLRRVQADQVDLLEHQHLGLADIQRAVGLGELFDTLLVFESYPMQRSTLEDTARRGGLTLADVDAHDDTHYPLTALVLPGEDLRISLKYQPSVFDAEHIRSLGERLRAVLARFVEAPEALLAQLNPLLPGETSSFTGATAREGDVGADIVAAAVRWPDRVALSVEGEHLTYAQLDARINQVTWALLERGAGPEKTVGVAARRGVELIVALLATMRSGSAFLPLDPDQPAARLSAMLSEADPVVVLTTSDLAAGLPGSVAVDQITGGPTVTPAVPVDPQHPAYVIYTSGSTGRPKGAVLTRGALYNRLSWMAEHYGFDHTDVIAQKTPAGFDVSVWEFFLPFMIGARLVVARPDGHRDPAYLVELIRRESVTSVHFVPSMLRAFLTDPEVAECRSLRRVLCSGEELSTELAARCVELLAGVQLHNLYGPTEATIDVTAARYDGQRGSGVPIGRAIDGVHLRVLDAFLRPVPPGVPGELYLGGVQLARGYLNRPGLSAASFVADPLGPPGARLYRTGDIVRAEPDGTCVYLGRSDHQVKIRGVRVEPGEAEAVLRAQPGITGAAVVPRDDGPSGTWLVGYVVADDTVDVRALRDAVAAELPDQFVPAAIVLLDALPLTSSGKLDRRSLPAPVRESGQASRAPDGPVETQLCALFADVLGLDTVGVDGNFFALGGDSISALRLASLARPLGLAFSPKQVFEAKTPEALALVTRHVETAHADRDGAGDVPLMPIMHRLLDRGGPYEAFSQSVLLHTPAGLTLPALTDGLAAVVAAHDMLRARLVLDGEPRLYVEREGQGPTPTRVDGVPGTEEIAAAEQDLVRALDPVAGDMVRVVWFDGGPTERGRLLIVAHHLVVDGVSWRILIGDLAGACRGDAVAPVRTSMRAWATGLRRRAPELADQLPTWLTMLAGDPPRLGNRAPDPERDVLAATERLVVRVPKDVTSEVLTSLPQTLRAQTQDVLLAALLAAVARGGDAAPLIRLEGHGREEELVDGADLTRTVGWFTSAFPVRLDATGVNVDDVFAGGPAAGTLVKRVRETLRALPDRGAGYGVLRYLDPASAARLAPLPEPLIGFNYLGRFDSTSGGDWALDAGALGGGGDPRMRVSHPLDINVLVDSSGMRASFTYLPEVVPDVQATADSWVAALHALVSHAARPESAEVSAEDLNLVNVNASQLDRLRKRFG
ncbi:non-ribosomal peptide synthetase [Pseudonocardia spinosispora]|uniref:non-ribosomal peptide synthetase n=1 Tax=Pseudonocardia spinosispora TaxID=103441 RepID=UPI000415BF75|nr:non-ribosomal peptide synthetase [Pseudonocardia spinosispora]